MERRRLADARGRSRLSAERLRQAELDIEDASRVLRRARTQVQLARDQLEDLEERHWALLGTYNPSQAGEKIAEALKVFGVGEPVVKTRVEEAKPTTTESTSIDRSPVDVELPQSLENQQKTEES